MKWMKQAVGYALALSLLPLLSACIGSDEEPVAVVADFPIAYVKRPLQRDEDDNTLERVDARDLRLFQEGGDLYIRDRASPSASERNITFEETSGLGDVKDVEVSYDGNKLLFAMRMPELENVDDDEQPTWNIWEYDIGENELRRIIASDVNAEEGQDVAPYYLPDGRIVFSSTRQRVTKAVLLDEGKPQFSPLREDGREEAFVLHVMNADGSDITQISFNQSNDFDPSVMSDGKILFSRWENLINDRGIHLYRMRPDGRELEYLYGINSHDTGTDDSEIHFFDPRELQNGDVMSMIRPLRSTHQGGNLITIDIDNYIENDQATWENRNALTGPAQIAVSSGDISTLDAPSPGGRIHDAYPLWDGSSRFLITWSLCRVAIVDAIAEETEEESDEVDEGRFEPCLEEHLADESIEEAPPLYAVYMLESDGSQLPVVTPREDVMISEVVVAMARTTPPVLFDHVGGVDVDEALFNENAAVLNVRSVYDMDGIDVATPSIAALADPAQATVADRPAHFLRVVKAASLDEDVEGEDFGRSRRQLMREILGYAPIEPDGSVLVKIPANVPFTLSVLDIDGRRVTPLHRSWMQLRAGEVMQCQGCHNAENGSGHGRFSGSAPSVHAGAPTDGLPFPNTIATMTALMGETMAETRHRHRCTGNNCPLAPDLSVDLVYEDVWTDPDVRAADDPFSYLYADLQTTIPTSTACVTRWTVLCRIVINYETHIHPLWSLTREMRDPTDSPVDTCQGCHTTEDNTRVPDGQLDLFGVTGADPRVVYDELFVRDVELELNDDGQLVPVQVQRRDGNGNLVFETDENGELILDGEDNPIPVMDDVPAPGPSMSVNGANSSYFLDVFTDATREMSVSHLGWLTAAELRLISEWLDVGGQYYNDPFASRAEDE